jgi:hypothetical protein
MVILYLFASILGALTTFIVLSSQGWLVALLCAYLGGSALALIIAIAVFVLRAKEGIVVQNVADAGPSMSFRPAPAPV